MPACINVQNTYFQSDLMLGWQMITGIQNHSKTSQTTANTASAMELMLSAPRKQTSSTEPVWNLCLILALPLCKLTFLQLAPASLSAVCKHKMQHDARVCVNRWGSNGIKAVQRMTSWVCEGKTCLPSLFCIFLGGLLQQHPCQSCNPT